MLEWVEDYNKIVRVFEEFKCKEVWSIRIEDDKKKTQGVAI